MTNYYKLQRNISSRFSKYSEANASVLLENLEEMFPQYYMHRDVFSMFKYSTTHWCVTFIYQSIQLPLYIMVLLLLLEK